MAEPDRRVAEAFVAMAHRIVWASVATVGADARPRSRVLHPVWDLADDGTLTGWVGTGPTAIKRAHLDYSPYVSCNYWDPSQDTCVAECRAEWVFDDEGRTAVWNRLRDAPEPVGYDPAIIPQWTSPTAPSFAGLRLTPWRLRVMPASVLLEGSGEVLTWRDPERR